LKKVLFSGCSYTQGTGFEEANRTPKLWVNLLHQNSTLHNHQLICVAEAGRSNASIFNSTLYELTHNKIDYAFVQWTSMPRYELQLGLELYSTKVFFIPNAGLFDVNTNEINYSKSYLEKIRDRFVTLVNIHYEILDLVRYVNILIKIAELSNTKIFFINGLCPWDNGYFTQLNNAIPSDYTPFTKTLINVGNRDDEEIFKLYNKIHQEYTEAGTIQESHWLNLYSSMLSTKIDTNNDNVHPGIKSNHSYYTNFLKALEEKL
jgi:hypothetical protein